MHRFDLIRDVDVTGVSGRGRIATGIVLPFRLGAVMRWLTPTWTLVWYPRAGWVQEIHGHDGATRTVRRGWFG